ncbi:MULTISPECIES: CVNH domain-containing protein [Xanthobacter]|uniref:CVNH domain-containing protein n=1 Tax=Xanthobacter TaxID=279 RepID=UPI001F3D8C57|nr:MULTISPECIES: CVNH domain-containing protein [unclassified Xanthobacter]
MKRRVTMGRGWAGLLALLVLLLAGASAPAQAQPAPPGTYQRTCRDVRVHRGSDLTALCETARRGVFTATRLDDFFTCRGDIANVDGHLWCERGRGPGPRPLPPPGTGNGPPGSYRASCTMIDQRGMMLAATCRTRSGEWRPTEMNMLGCIPGTDISNDNGNLRCRRQPVPPGSYLQTCRDAVAAGPWLAASCRNMNGGWQNTRLNVATCGPRPNIVNFNGNLICR